MIKLLYYTLILALCGLPGAVNADQTCRTDSEIPASTPTTRFTDHGDRTVTDTQTELMWAKCAEGLSGDECLGSEESKHSWEEALDLANSSELADYNDWRLPNIKELLSIVERQCIEPAINLSVFPNTRTDASFWTASPNGLNSKSAMSVWFKEGSLTDGARSSTIHVRLVRSGQ